MPSEVRVLVYSVGIERRHAGDEWDWNRFTWMISRH